MKLNFKKDSSKTDAKTAKPAIMPENRDAVKKASTEVVHALPAKPEPMKLMENKLKIIAEVDVGFGNCVYIRGDGCGLNWGRGVALKPIADNIWEWECSCGKGNIGFEFKLLLNDTVWSIGENYVAICRENRIQPKFS